MEVGERRTIVTWRAEAAMAGTSVPAVAALPMELSTGRRRPPKRPDPPSCAEQGEAPVFDERPGVSVIGMEVGTVVVTQLRPQPFIGQGRMPEATPTPPQHATPVGVSVAEQGENDRRRHGDQ